EKILSKMENIAKECSLQSVENNWKGALQPFKKLDFKNLHEKNKNLSCQMNVMQCTCDKNNNGFAASGIDEKLVSSVNSTHNLLSLLKLLNEKRSTKGVLSFDTKLSEIKTAGEKNRKYAQSYTQK
ncbi:peptidoglycan-binding protein, partial [Candidatus Liberibacter asiaticus]